MFSLMLIYLPEHVGGSVKSGVDFVVYRFTQISDIMEDSKVLANTNLKLRKPKNNNPRVAHSQISPELW